MKCVLDKLQGVLYKRQIEKVEGFFRSEIRKLMRKTHFIDDICIDDNFNTHIYRTEAFYNSNVIRVYLLVGGEDEHLPLEFTKKVKRDVSAVLRVYSCKRRINHKGNTSGPWSETDLQ
mgnify:CR=1 FL=1